MNAPIPDFTPTELAVVDTLLARRFGHPVPVELADAELALDPGSQRTTDCPTLYWAGNGAQFVVCKVGAAHYRCQFFYADTEQYGTGRDEYADLEDCVLTLLRVQSDHRSARAGVTSGATGADLDGDPDDDWPPGPATL